MKYAIKTRSILAKLIAAAGFFALSCSATHANRAGPHPPLAEVSREYADPPTPSDTRTLTCLKVQGAMESSTCAFAMPPKRSARKCCHLGKERGAGVMFASPSMTPSRASTPAAIAIPSVAQQG